MSSSMVGVKPSYLLNIADFTFIGAILALFCHKKVKLDIFNLTDF